MKLKHSLRRTAAGALALTTLLGAGSCSLQNMQYSAALANAVIALPDYPDCAPYPDERADDFDKQYRLWSDSNKERIDAARSLRSPDSFYGETIGRFLSEADGGNRVYSPVNVYMALAMLAEATDGDSRAQILSLLGYDDIGAMREQAEKMWAANYRDDGGTSIILANSLWLNDKVKYDRGKLQDLAKSYYASSFKGDPADPDMTRLLREWLNAQTRGLLEEAADGVELSPETVLSLCSTVYLSAKWSSEFNESDNDTRVFHKPDGDVETTFMNGHSGYGPYYAGDDFGAIRLDFEDGGGMWLILPDEDKTVDDVLRSRQYLNMVLPTVQYNNQKTVQINYSVPKFDVSSDFDLCDGLKELGVSDVFSMQKSDFSPLIKDSPAAITEAKHAARVVIDEKGCKAAAFTAMMVCGAALPPEDEIDFVLDRPFLFVITGGASQPLFAGVVNNPC